MYNKIKNIIRPSVKYLSTNPTSRLFVIEKGTPIDRYYIKQFLYQNKSDIKGNVVEISERTYTQCFAFDTIKKVML